jgi:hypothetical protein
VLPTTRHPLVSLLIPLVLTGIAANANAQNEMTKDRAPGAATVAVENCKEWLGKLASQEFEGRKTGQPGFQKAADYVAAHFKALGLEARGENGSYFQHVPWSTTRVKAEKSFLSFEAGGETLRIPAERLVGSATTALSAGGEVLLLVVRAPEPAQGQQGQGQGQRGRIRIDVPKLEGLDALDVKDKFVVAFVQTTEATLSSAIAARFAVQQGLQGKEPASLVFAQQEAPNGGLRSGRTGAGRGAGGNPALAGGRRGPPDVTFGGKDLDALLKLAGKDAAVLAGAAAATLVPLPVKGTLEIAVDEDKQPTMNVFGVLPGSDGKLKDEYVVIGSHLDHLGRRGDEYCPGADDDGSGTTGVMAMAQMFAKNPTRPARSILFVCFAGEEDGLRGSRFFADNCPIPLASIAAELQMDMIGRDEEEAMDGGRRVNIGEKAEENRNSLHLVGTEKLAPALHALCLAKNEAAGFALEFDQEGLFSRSDHANFARMGVPVAFFFTGLHRDYHQVTDTPDKINYPKLLRVVRYVYDIAFELASPIQRPEIDPRLWSTMGDRRSEKPAAPLMQAPATAGDKDEKGKK